uniref:Uncharacterized protein n=1 Tax=Rhizophora mucronata TaxID=61149 RepID=A0A2P2PMA3_RHIMU
MVMTVRHLETLVIILIYVRKIQAEPYFLRSISSIAKCIIRQLNDI